MWQFGPFRSHRSSEGRRKLTNGTQPWHQRFRAILCWPLVIAVGFWACTTLIVLSADEPLLYSVGMELSRPVLSRVDFERVNEFQTEELRRKTQQAIPNYFLLNKALVDQIQAEFRDLHAAVKASEDFEKYQEAHSDNWPLDEKAFEVLQSLTDEHGSDKFRLNVDKLARSLAGREMIERAEVDREIRSTASHVMLGGSHGKFREVLKERLNYATNPGDVEALAGSLVRGLFAEEIKPLLMSIIIKAISPGNDQYQPVYVFEAALTKSKTEEAAASVPFVKDRYEAGDRLVNVGRITGEEFALLKIEHEAYLSLLGTDQQLRDRWQKKCWGLMGVILLVTLGLCIFTYYVQPRIARKTPRAFALAGLLLVMLAFDRFVLLPFEDSPVWSVITIAMSAAILTIAYSQLFAIGTTAALSLLTILALGASYSMVIVLLTVAAVTVLMLREIRTRMKMLKVGVATSVAAFSATLLIGLADGQGANWFNAGLAFLAAGAGLSLVLVLLPVIEKLFGITTSLTLLEWADNSHPLLRQLIERAPGTWQHSNLLGSMAETAAEEIGANGLLVRVGAYYHDIGKICKPNYFIENQEAQMNAHRGLAPTMSLLVILAHVKDGLAMARENRLPPVLHQFIAEHHGTTVVSYFHHMASKEAKASGEKHREISDTEFRYPGPKPRSRESAILMLCDGVEGAVRSLQDPTPGRIEGKVHEILMARLMDGQFDDCEITLKELARIEQSLVKSLRAIHHGRIAYPKSIEPATAQVSTA
ncbi:MAG: HDIG domain-containing protein [Phycisphaerales bacterium]|nr:HDIG domain-containing protein [Phycisphaerales bacterium]